MGRASQIIGYIIGFIVLILGLVLIVGSLSLPVEFAGSYLVIALMIFVFGIVIIGLGYRSRPTKEKKMLKMQAEEFFRQENLRKEREKREKEEIKRQEKEREKLKKEMEKREKESEKESEKDKDKDKE